MKRHWGACRLLKACTRSLVPKSNITRKSRMGDFSCVNRLHDYYTSRLSVRKGDCVRKNFCQMRKRFASHIARTAVSYSTVAFFTVLTGKIVTTVFIPHYLFLVSPQFFSAFALNGGLKIGGSTLPFYTEKELSQPNYPYSWLLD